MRDAKRRPRSSRDRYRDWLALQGSFVGRVASHLEEVARLVGAGSAEPRRWIEDYANLWSGLVGDVGDWIKQESGGALRPTQNWISRCRFSISYQEKTKPLKIEIPLEAFQDQNGKKYSEIHLIVFGLSRVGKVKGVTLEPGTHLSFKHEVVKKSNRLAELSLYDLPPLRQGDLYGGLVWAKETKLPVAAIEILIE